MIISVFQCNVLWPVICDLGSGIWDLNCGDQPYFLKKINYESINIKIVEKFYKSQNMLSCHVSYNKIFSPCWNIETPSEVEWNIEKLIILGTVSKYHPATKTAWDSNSKDQRVKRSKNQSKGSKESKLSISKNQKE